MSSAILLEKRVAVFCAAKDGARRSCTHRAVLHFVKHSHPNPTREWAATLAARELLQLRLDRLKLILVGRDAPFAVKQHV